MTSLGNIYAISFFRILPLDFPLFVSQDSNDEAIAQLIRSYSEYGVNHIQVRKEEEKKQRRNFRRIFSFSFLRFSLFCSSLYLSFFLFSSPLISSPRISSRLFHFASLLFLFFLCSFSSRLISYLLFL